MTGWRGQGRCIASRLGGSLSVPCSLQALMPDDASFEALGADFVLVTIFQVNWYQLEIYTRKF
jgi:hypothetical protein